MNQIKFLKKGIRVNGEYFKVFYTKGGWVNMCEKTIGIYIRECKHFPKVKGLTIKNDSDSLTDYYEKDKIYVHPGNKYYNEVNEVCN